jgi:hypothetical protein
LNNPNGQKLYQAIGLVSDDTIAIAENNLNAGTTSNSETITVIPTQSAPIKRGRAFRMQFAGIAAAVLLLVVGTVTMLHFLSPERSGNFVPAEQNPYVPEQRLSDDDSTQYRQLVMNTITGGLSYSPVPREMFTRDLTAEQVWEVPRL